MKLGLQIFGDKTLYQTYLEMGILNETLRRYSKNTSAFFITRLLCSAYSRKLKVIYLLKEKLILLSIPTLTSRGRLIK
jgi:hypothetical protein